MPERLPTENLSANEQNDERVKHLKQASRVIITTREKMPHSAQWHLSLRRTLWRYTQEVLLRKSRSQPNQIKQMEEKISAHQSRSACQEPARQQRDL